MSQTLQLFIIAEFHALRIIPKGLQVVNQAESDM